MRPTTRLVRRGPLGAAAVVALLLVSGCGRLPDADSPGAKLYAERCTNCHRTYLPGVLKFEMWKVILKRMQGEFARRGLPPLTPDEEQLLLDYLQKHAAR